MPQAKKIAVVGSSHVTWWELAIERGQIPRPRHDITFVGRSAMPIWADFIKSGIAAVEDQVDLVFLFLGDLRFGNRILKSKKFIRSGDTSGNFLAIEKELISDENDRIMLDLTVNYLNELYARLGQKLRILHWSLTFREFYNKENGRYGGRENYHHPVWNVADLVGQFRDVTVDTTPLTDLPIHSYFLDGNGHCTGKGFAFIYRLLDGLEAADAYHAVRAGFETWGHLLFPPDAGHYRINITGDSIAFKALQKAVNARYFLMPSCWKVNDLKASKDSAGRYDRAVYLSGLHFQDESPAQIKTKIAEEQAAILSLNLGGQVTVIFWDQWARETVSKRPEYRNLYLPKSAEGYVERIEQAFAPYEVRRLSNIPFIDADGLIECGGSFDPSCKGYAALFHLMVSESLVPTALTRFGQMIGICLDHVQPSITADTLKQEDNLTRLQGYFGGVTADGLSGWAIDPVQPGRRVPIHLFASPQPIAILVADQFQTNVKPTHDSDGFCGFSSGPLALSLLRNLRPGIEIRASFDAEGRFELANSPIKLNQEDLSNLALAAIKPRQAEFHAQRHLPGSDYRIPNDGSSLFIARQTTPEHDPSIYPRTEVVLDNAVVEAIDRLPAFFKAVVRARVIGGIYREDGTLEQSALGNSAFGVFQLADETLTSQPTRHIDAECLYGGIIIDHYDHFLIESLVRFQAFHQFPSLPIVFTHYAGITRAAELPSYIKAIFELLNIPLERIILVQETTSFKKLVIPKAGMRWFDYLAPDHQQAMAAQVKASFGADYPHGQQGSTYLSRSTLSTSHGGNIICGETEFENYLKTEGISVVHPETLTVKEQVRLFCSARNLIGFVGSGFHTLLLCPNVPEKIFYLTHNKAAVSPQFPLIDETLGIDGHYLDKVIKNSPRVTLVDFGAISQSLLASGLVQNTFDAGQHDFETEFVLLSDWLAIKNRAKNLSAQDKERLEIIADGCLNRAVAKEARTLLGLETSNA